MCTDFVSKDWNPSKTIRTVLEKLLSLLTTPDPGMANAMRCVQRAFP